MNHAKRGRAKMCIGQKNTASDTGNVRTWSPKALRGGRRAKKYHRPYAHKKSTTTKPSKNRAHRGCHAPCVAKRYSLTARPDVFAISPESSTVAVSFEIEVMVA